MSLTPFNRAFRCRPILIKGGCGFIGCNLANALAGRGVVWSARGRKKSSDLIWIGNWGDEERSREPREFLIEPAAGLHLRTRVHGVRYPNHATAMLRNAGITYAGWLPNHRVPEAFASARVAVHILRQVYSEMLGGIPTIRVFEALACGIPLVCSPWPDRERLFPPGCYLQAANGDEMAAAYLRRTTRLVGWAKAPWHGGCLRHCV